MTTTHLVGDIGDSPPSKPSAMPAFLDNRGDDPERTGEGGHLRPSYEA
jgi:hypothetical protein